MVIFGINNIATDFENNTTETSVLNTTETTVLNTTETTVLNTTETTVLNTTETTRVNESSSVHPRPKDVLDNDDEEIQFFTPKVEIESPQTESDEEGVKVTTDIENLINPLDTNGTLSLRDNGSLNSKGLAFRSYGTERVNGGGEDIVISNKTVIINGGNDSITITN
jgi:hypothetical protein